MNVNHETLVQFNQGDAHAFKIVFDLYRMRIFYFVHGMIQDRHAAEEITSDTFVKLSTRHYNFQTQKNIQAFLFVTARRAALDFIKVRKRRSIHEIITNDSMDDEVAEMPMSFISDIEAEVLQFILDEIELLPKRSKIIFKLFYFEKLTVNQIATKLDISPQTVANQKSTALKQLRLKVIANPGLFVALCCILKNVNNSC